MQVPRFTSRCKAPNLTDPTIADGWSLKLPSSTCLNLESVMAACFNQNEMVHAHRGINLDASCSELKEAAADLLRVPSGWYPIFGHSIACSASYLNVILSKLPSSNDLRMVSYIWALDRGPGQTDSLLSSCFMSDSRCLLGALERGRLQFCPKAGGVALERWFPHNFSRVIF